MPAAADGRWRSGDHRRRGKAQEHARVPDEFVHADAREADGRPVAEHEDDEMTSTESKIVQYLHEAHAMELALVRTLQAHRAITPTGPYRTLLDRHLTQTR